MTGTQTGGPASFGPSGRPPPATGWGPISVLKPSDYRAPLPAPRFALPSPSDYGPGGGINVTFPPSVEAKDHLPTSEIQDRRAERASEANRRSNHNHNHNHRSIHAVETAFLDTSRPTALGPATEARSDTECVWVKNTGARPACGENPSVRMTLFARGSGIAVPGLLILT